MRSFFRFIAITMFLSIMALPAYVWAEPIIHFSFDEADGDIVMDMTNGGHNGTLKEGAAIVNDIVRVGNGAIKIEPENAAMEVESFTELEEYQDNTFLFWLYFTAGTNGAWSQVLAKVGPADRSPGIWINPGALALHYRYNPGNVGFSAIGPTGEGSQFEQNEWYHIACVKEGAELRFYVNGEEQGVVTTAPDPHENAAGILYVGKSASYRAATFIMDDLAIYNSPLSVDEIEMAMNGVATSVDTTGKLINTWGNIKSKH